MGNIDWNSILVTNVCDKSYSNYSTAIRVGFENCFPLVKVSIKRGKDTKWIRKGLKISSNTKNRLFRNLNSKHSLAKLEKYTRYTNMFIKICAKAKANNYHDLLLDTKRLLKALWDTFGPIINPGKANKKCSVDKLIQNNNVISDNAAIANTFNDYLQNAKQCKIQEVSSR